MASNPMRSAITLLSMALLSTPARAQTSLRILPVVGSSPETGFVGGVTALRVSTASDTTTRPTTDQVYAAYTAKQQFRAFVSTDRWSRANVWGANAQLEYQRFPQPFFGVGIDAPESAEEWYEARSVLASVTVRRKVARALFVQAGYRFSDTQIRDADEGGVIARNAIRGATGGAVSQLSGGGAWDSRDNLFAPASGSFVQATAAYSTDALGADFTFGRYVADARRYMRVGPGVLAGQAYLEATSGGAPFDQLSLVGNSTILRGYVRGRYRDRELAAAQLEYRLPVVARFGVAAFAGVGTVAPTLGTLLSSDLLPTFGGGARYLLLPKQRTTIRVDYGVGKSSSGLYIAFNEAF
ncbi:MAG TPA: BamA/TamA family outer membrane protein [Gemmatimonadaceae bacterium]|nr:BamA/TamA family outer membrane protein [Gemmatimonadaceae bacterium]